MMPPDLQSRASMVNGKAYGTGRIAQSGVEDMHPWRRIPSRNPMQRSVPQSFAAGHHQAAIWLRCLRLIAVCEVSARRDAVHMIITRQEGEEQQLRSIDGRLSHYPALGPFDSAKASARFNPPKGRALKGRRTDPTTYGAQ